MTTHAWRAKYEAHIRSEQWRNMRRDMIRLRGDRCQRCGLRHELQLHHKTYERLGRELTSDLELLCKECHAKADEERATKGRIKSAQAIYGAGLETYASKKYGDDWQTWIEEERICAEFDEWLERKAGEESDRPDDCDYGPFE